MSEIPSTPDCRAAFEKIDGYADRELSEIEMMAVKRHLEECPPCQQYFHVHEGVKRLVHRNACPEKAPQQLIERIKKSLLQ